MKSEYWKILLNDYADKEEAWVKELDIEFPLYMQSYREALSAILKNISYNQAAHQKKQEQESIFIGAGSEHINLDESNIFAFVGERGTGKTTALYEFCRILHDYNRISRKWKEEIDLEADLSNPCYFHVMKPIDASVLEKKEDLLEVILANMYEVFQKKAKRNKDVWAATSCLGKNLSYSFDQVYKAYLNLGNLREQKIYGEPVLAELMNTSNSLKLKTEVEGLLENLLSLLEGDIGNKRENSYLVIPIDDLDLNLENGYEMLEQLQKYLASRKVIILITMNYKQMKMICENQIVDSLIPEYGGVHRQIYDKFDKGAWKISNDYLLKVLPLANRIYMPKHQLIYKKASILLREPDEKKLTVKEFVLKKIVLQMNIYYDALGLKKHFCLPDTVRELVTYDDFLNSLTSMEKIRQLDAKKEGTGWLAYDQNHERFNKDIENRMALQVLDDEQGYLFGLLMERDIIRRAQYTVSFLNFRIKRKKDGFNINGRALPDFCLRDTVDDQRYCYADLLEVLYNLGRTDYFDKPLVHCLLASFTSEMVREYYSYMYGSEGGKARSLECLKGVLGKTFGGKWFENVFPKMEVPGTTVTTVQNDNKPELMIDVAEGPKIQIAFIANAFLKSWKIKLKNVKSKSNREQIWIEPLTDLVPYLECLTLFFSDFVDKEGKPTNCKWEFEINNGEPYELTIRNKAYAAVFDIFGFIGKEIMGQKIGKAEGGLCGSLAEELCKSVMDYFQRKGYHFTQSKERFKKKFSETASAKSIWRNQKPGETVGSAFPYYNLDMSYNVMKRVRLRIRQDVNLAENSIYDYYRIVYGYIAEELWREQEYYRKLLDKSSGPHFYEDFVNHPFIRIFRVQCESERQEEEIVNKEGQQSKEEIGLDPKIFNNLFYQAIKDLASENLKGIMEEQDIVE